MMNKMALCPRKSQINEFAIWVIGIFAGLLFLYAVWRILINAFSP